MVNITYDLHIHSCLSPCADDDMTPSNIAGMAFIKGLDVIAVTDHNSCRNCPAVFKACWEYGVLPIAGMELCTSEEVHVLCLFPDLHSAIDFNQYVYSKMLHVLNHEKIFGRQLLYNEKDRIIGTEPRLLITGAKISFEELSPLLKDYGGIMIPAHIDKSSNSLLSNLGLIPPGSVFSTAELKDLTKLHQLRDEHSYLSSCHIIRNSDAHYLEHINEPELTISVKSKTVKDILTLLDSKV